MILSVVRWFFMMLINLLGFITAPFMFPVAYVLRNVKLVRRYILWIYYDDEIPAAWDYQLWLKGRKENFWTAYKWSFRNPAWNLQASLKPKKGVKKFISCKGRHSQNGNFDISVFDMCVLRFIDKDYAYSNNQGKYLSYVHSIIGKMMVWYKIENTLYWRFSFANKLLWRIWLEVMAGTNDDRYLFKIKLKYITNGY